MSCGTVFLVLMRISFFSLSPVMSFTSRFSEKWLVNTIRSTVTYLEFYATSEIPNCWRSGGHLLPKPRYAMDFYLQMSYCNAFLHFNALKTAMHSVVAINYRSSMCILCCWYLLSVVNVLDQFEYLHISLLREYFSLEFLPAFKMLEQNKPNYM